MRALSTTSPDINFVPEARLVVSRRLLADELQRAVQSGLRLVKDIEIEIPFIGAVALRASIEVDSVDAEAVVDADCAGCILLTVNVSGLLRPMSGAVSLPPLPWHGVARGPVALLTITRPDGRRELTARAMTTAAADQGWAVEVEVDGFSQFAPTLNALAAQQVRRLVAGDDAPEIVLAALPVEVSQRIRGLRPGADRGAVVVDLAFVALGVGHLDTAIPVVEEGFAIVVPEATVLAVANAAILQQPPRDGWTGALRAFSVDGGAFVIDIDIWELGREPRLYDVRATGTIVVGDNGLQLAIEHAEHRTPAKGFDPVSGIVRAEIERRVEGARALLAGRGDIAGSLFDASVGGGGDVRALLAEEADVHDQ